MGAAASPYKTSHYEIRILIPTSIILIQPYHPSPTRVRIEHHCAKSEICFRFCINIRAKSDGGHGFCFLGTYGMASVENMRSWWRFTLPAQEGI
ncbi:hypothetical protein D5086_029157 [Populus alba]|uniref:Uncharacterized protein n=2 Tax=Populus TaxID=3689 RepID=A0ACC4AST2_POPAL|nr:hypothetical protein NC653_036290 [Populus alba x Populus x berolinensis]